MYVYNLVFAVKGIKDAPIGDGILRETRQVLGNRFMSEVFGVRSKPFGFF